MRVRFWRKSGMVQNKINILSTGKLKQTQIDFASSKNIHIQDMTFIETTRITTEDLSKRIMHLSHHPQHIVFTSERAVEAVAAVLSGSGPAWNIFCLGSATKKGVQKHFQQSQIKGSAGSAGSLADLIIGEENIYSVIFFCGDKRRPELPDKLKAAGIEVIEIEVYKTVETPQVTSLHFSGIIFFSPSAVKSFFSVNKINKEPVLFAIGQTTAAEIARHTGNKIMVSEQPSKDSMVHQAIAYFQIHSIQN
jgi:uroporphyrinogen-III synthase